MSHHHRIIVPAVTNRPTCAGEWDVRYVTTYAAAKFNGNWFRSIVTSPWHRTLVTETPAAGRLCRELRMGGSIHCGLAPWSGQWRKAQ